MCVLLLCRVVLKKKLLKFFSDNVIIYLLGVFKGLFAGFEEEEVDFFDNLRSFFEI